jgi:hypothetical protein
MKDVEGAAIQMAKNAGTLPSGTVVATRVPNPRPARLLRMQRTNGDQRNMIQERPTLLVEAWGPTELDAWEVAKAAHEIFDGRTPLEHNGIELEERVVSSPVNYPDPSTSSPRYTFTITATVTL